MFCPRCGTETPDDSRFCRKCGRALVGNANRILFALIGGLLPLIGLLVFVWFTSHQKRSNTAPSISPALIQSTVLTPMGVGCV